MSKEDPRVEKARQLLRAAELDKRSNLKADIAKRLCKCGHKRGSHGEAHSINYTGGACLECGCLNYQEDHHKISVGTVQIIGFPGREVDRHLKLYGHLPELGCCEHDQPVKGKR